jgi:hypothetical protein
MQISVHKCMQQYNAKANKFSFRVFMTLSPHSIYFYLHAFATFVHEGTKIIIKKYILKTVFDP